MLQHVKGVGRRDEIVEVSDGFALNSLIPARQAAQATQQQRDALQKRKASEADKAKTESARTRAVIAKINGAKVVMEVRANTQGSLFKGVTVEDIASALSDLAGSALDPRLIQDLDEPIKQIGELAIHVSGEGAKALVHVAIVALAKRPASH